MTPTSPNLLVVLSRRAEDDICRLFLPFWQRSGYDILFSSPLDAMSELEGPFHHVFFGRELNLSNRSTWWWYQSRFLDTMKYCLELPYQGFLFTQYDSICLGQLPTLHPDCSIHLIAGGPAAPFQSSFFLHPPWCFGSSRLRQFVEAASTYDIKTTEQGIMDRWLSLIIERHGQPFTPCCWAWSVNSIDTPEYVACAQQAIRNGCLFIHGVKNHAQLTAILP